jgi:hypothetical protein
MDVHGKPPWQPAEITLGNARKCLSSAHSALSHPVTLLLRVPATVRAIPVAQSTAHAQSASLPHIMCSMSPRRVSISLTRVGSRSAASVGWSVVKRQGSCRPCRFHITTCDCGPKRWSLPAALAATQVHAHPRCIGLHRTEISYRACCPRQAIVEELTHDPSSRCRTGRAEDHTDNTPASADNRDGHIGIRQCFPKLCVTVTLSPLA